MKQRKRVFCKIYLPNLGYSKTTLQLSPYHRTTYYLITYYPTTYYPTTYYPTTYYPTTYYPTTWYPATYSLPQHHLQPYHLLPYYLLLTTAPLTILSLTTLLLTTLLLTPLQHVPLFFDTQLCFATHKWGINPKFIITLPSTSVHERSVYLGFASQRYHTPLNFRPAQHIAFGGLYKAQRQIQLGEKQQTRHK